jgi:hypothetical protein
MTIQVTGALELLVAAVPKTEGMLGSQPLRFPKLVDRNKMILLPVGNDQGVVKRFVTTRPLAGRGLYYWCWPGGARATWSRAEGEWLRWIGRPDGVVERKEVKAI